MESLIFYEGLSAPEGPAFLEDGSMLIVEMGLDRGCVSLISKNGKALRTIVKTGGPNGLAVDKSGAIWVTETLSPSLVKATIDGSKEVFSSGLPDNLFLFPNDVAVGPEDWLYMTDSGILNKYFSPGGVVVPHYRELTFDGKIFRINPQTGKTEILDTGLKFPNGIAFNQDGHLFINETITGDIYRYEIENGFVTKKNKFGNVDPIGDPNLIFGPDGMKFDIEGNLFVATLGHGDITVLDQNGVIIERIKAAGRLTTNLAFGPKGSKKIYVTEVEFGRIEVFDVGVDGLSLFH